MKENKTKLSQHILKKGKFITPWNDAFGERLQLKSWANTRLPEYFWIGLILNYYGREKSINIFPPIFERLKQIDDNISLPLFSKILDLPDDQQKDFYTFICSIIDIDVFSPLTLLYTYSEYPIFTQYFCNTKIRFSERRKILEDVLQKCYNSQTEFTTDIKYWVTFMVAKYHKIVFNSNCTETMKALCEYISTSHDDEKMRTYRSLIRSLEAATSDLMSDNTNNTNFINVFWEKMSSMSDCMLYSINFEVDNNKSKQYIELLYKILRYLTDLYTSCMPLDNKMTTILGIYTFAYKRILEIVECNLYNTLSGRSSIRNLIEVYVTLKYLYQKESENGQIWSEFQNYGIGQLKTIVTRFRDFEPKECSHVDCNLLEILVNDYKQEEFLDMDTSYFDKLSFRGKAEEVNEKELFGLYDYDSIYEHGLWGAIRESCMLNCNNPAHQYHCVPDCENAQKLKSIWPDCVMLMNKILTLINSSYEIPKTLIDEVKNFETNKIN